MSQLFEAKAILRQYAKGKHRSDHFSRDILPLALLLAEAIGHIRAVEAAQKAGIDFKLLELYISEVTKEDPA
jgi:hypothetical protein